MAVDNDNNLPVAVDDGNQAIIGTDIFSNSGVTAHAQVMKVAWGNELTVNRVTSTSPMPVQVYGLTGSLSTVTITGSVYGLGSFNVANTAGSPVHVTGGIRTFVYGVTGAPAVAVTGSVILGSSVGITGTVTVTGGKVLNWDVDRVQVTGSLGKSWNLSNLTDSIQVYGPAGSTHVFARIMGPSGTPIGASGDALNVNVVGAGISATVNVSSNVSVQNVTGTVLRIQGTANGEPIPVSGTVSLSANTEVLIDDESPVNVIPPESLIIYGKESQDESLLNSFEKVFVAPETGTSKYHTVATWLRYVYDILGGATGANTLLQQIKNIGDGTNTVKTKSSTNLTSNPKVFVYSITGTNSTYTIFNLLKQNLYGTDVLATSLATNGYLYQNKSTEIIYLTSTSHISNVLGSSCVTSGTGCRTGTTSDTIDVRISSASADVTALLHGCYVLEPGTSALLPTLFDRAFITTTLTTTSAAILNITLV
jgi:hypothetical protein